jgi:hypothetical protein
MAKPQIQIVDIDFGGGVIINILAASVVGFND